MLIQLKAYTTDPSNPSFVIRERCKGGKPSNSALVRLIRGAREFYGEDGLPTWLTVEVSYLHEDSEDLPQVQEGQYVMWFNPSEPESENYIEAFSWGWEIKRLPAILRPLKGEAIVYQAGNTTWKTIYTFK